MPDVRGHVVDIVRSVFDEREQILRCGPRRFTAQIVFEVLTDVPNHFIPVNPIGLHISHMRVDESFDEPQRTGDDDMPLIPRRSEDDKTRVRLTASVTNANYQTLLKYAIFLGEDVEKKAAKRGSVDRLIHGPIELLAKDRDFVQSQRPAAEKRTGKPDVAA